MSEDLVINEFAWSNIEGKVKKDYNWESSNSSNQKMILKQYKKDTGNVTMEVSKKQRITFLRYEKF